MQTSPTCDPSRPAALSRLICRPNGVTLFGGAVAALAALSGILLATEGTKAKIAGSLGMIGAGTMVAASSSDATRWAKQTKVDVQHKVADMRQARAERKAAVSGAPVPVAISVAPAASGFEG